VGGVVVASLGTRPFKHACIIGGVFAAVLLAQAASGPVARAGTYDVVACNSAPGWVNNSWTPATSGTRHTDGMGTYSYNCPASDTGTSGGMRAAINSLPAEPGRASASAWPSAFALTSIPTYNRDVTWAFQAAPGTTIVSIARSWHLYRGGSNTHPIGLYYTNAQGGWTLVDGHGPGGPVSTGSTFSSVQSVSVPETSNLSLRVECAGTTSCTQGGASASLKHVAVRVQDPSTPTLAVKGGSIPGGGWHAHTADIHFDAADNVGIRLVTLSIDGSERARRDFPCDFTRPAPCSNQPNQTLSFDTAGLSEGVHESRLSIVDAAGNETHYDRALKVDRSPPAVTLSDDLASLDFDDSGRDLYNLHIEANDEGSGIADERVRIDGAEVHSAVTPADCRPGACSLTTDFLLDTDTLAEGEHTIEATVADKSGRTFHRAWTIRVPGPGHFESGLAAWKADVERRVDDASPLALTRPMPAPPDRWRQPASCEVSEQAVRECFSAGQNWGADIRSWLDENLATTTGSASTLPDVPHFEYAIPELPRHLVRGLQEEFAVAKRAVADPAAVVKVAISFNRPVDKVHLQQLFSGLDLQEQGAIRGIYDPSAAAISGGLSVPSPVSLTHLIDQYYADQQQLASEQIADLHTAFEDPDPSDPEESEDIQQAIAEETAYKNHLTAGGPVVKGIAVRISLNALLSAVEQESSDIKVVQLLANAADLTSAGGDALDSIPTDAESAVATGSSGLSSSTAVPEAAASSHQPTCDDRGETAPTVPGTKPRYYMPNRGSGMNVFPYGSPDAEGDRRKRNAIYFRWQLANTLSWYCGDVSGDRGYEAETKVYPERPRWSTNWANDISYSTNIPRPYVDDLADGSFTAPYETQTYPDFSIGTAHARQFRYRKVYRSRFTTNHGETNAGTVVFRGSNTHRASGFGAQGYCTSRGRGDAYCMFLEHTTCLKYRHINDPATGYRVNWTVRPDENPLCHNPTQ
jgi:hypothetical protein